MTDSNVEIRALALFEASLNIPAEKRPEWLREQAGEDTDLLQKVLKLNAIDSKPASAIVTGQVPIDSDLPEDIPDRIGTYRISRLIGQGGMGAVYQGQRDSGDFDHVVAIKLIRSSVLSDSLRQRFDRERQTLAKLIHPNIARLYDGGETEQKNPYFVMEYVDGMPITHWVKQHDLSEKERIQLFLRVCEAVRYAHQNLIVHRDITPSNVLVNQQGQVKLIDFGIAKPSIEDTDDVNTSQSLASLSFTPGFAAPERAQGQSANTLADVYSLGKLLAAIFEDQSNSEELAAIISMSSAEKAEKRYQTVNALMVDLVSYLQHKPVEAFADTKSYVVRKFIQRNMAASIVTAGATLAVVIALVISIYQYQRAESHLLASEQRFNQVRELAKYQLFNLYDELKKVAGNTGTRADLAKKGQEYLTNLNLRTDASPELKLETAQGHIRLARIFGVPAEPNLGDADAAREELGKAKIILNSLKREVPSWPVLAESRADLASAEAMILVHEDSDLAQAKIVLDEAETILEQVPEAERTSHWYLALRNVRYTQLERSDQAGETDLMRDLAAQFIEDQNHWPSDLSQSTLKRQDQGWYYYWIALADYIDNLHETAMENFEKANLSLSELERQQQNDPMLLYILSWTNYIGYGSAAKVGELQRSISFLDRASNYASRLAELQEGDASIVRLGMQMREAKSQLLAEMGEFDEAIALQEELVSDQKRQALGKPEASQYETWAFSKIILAYMYKDHKQQTKACEQLEQAEKLLLPFAAEKRLSGYMLNAANRLDSRIKQCRAGEPLDSMNALFD